MTATPDSLQQRYEAIERVYSGRRWDDVAQRSEELLLELPDDPGHPLRQRLQLLLGHTYLYGYQDGATAAGFYSRVQAATKEPVLLDIATQGLEQCASQTAAPPTPQPAAPVGTGAMPAMPWLEELGGSTPVEVVDEPELIEVARADPARAEELEVAVLEEFPSAAQQRPAAVQAGPAVPIGDALSPEEIAELSKGLLRVVIR